MTPLMSSLQCVKHIGIFIVTVIPVIIQSKQLLFTCEEENVLNFEFRQIGTADYLCLRRQTEKTFKYINSKYFALYLRVHLIFPRNHLLNLDRNAFLTFQFQNLECLF
jgi:hypothetical protein